MGNAQITAITLNAYSKEYYWDNLRLYVLEHSVRAQGSKMSYLTAVHDATDWTIDDARSFLSY